jgi:transcriptional regulator with XRE-family HTH domain
VEPHEIFARNLLAQRQKKKLSQEQLGDRAGIHRTEVSLLERGAREPRLSTIVKLARALAVRPAELLRGIR